MATNRELNYEPDQPLRLRQNDYTLADAGINAAKSAARGAVGLASQVVPAVQNAATATRNAVVGAVNDPELARRARSAGQGIAEAWGQSPIVAGYNAVNRWADDYNRNAFVPQPAAAAAPAVRVPGTVGRIGRGPAPAVSDADLFPAAAASAAKQRPLRINDRQMGADAASVQPPADVPVSKPAVEGAVPASRMRNSLGISPAAFNWAGGGLSIMPNVAAAMTRGPGTQAEADNALLRKWYSMTPSERGNAPRSVLEAQNRGVDPSETAYNISRSQILDARMNPVAQAAALGAIEKSRAAAVNQAGETANRDRQTAVQERQADISAQHYAAQAADNATRRQQEAAYQNTMGQAATTQAQSSLLGAQELAATRKQTAREKAEANQFYPKPEIAPQLLEDPDTRAAYMGALNEWERGRAAWNAALTAPHNAGKSPEEILASLDPEQRFFMRAYLKGGNAPGYAEGGVIQAPQYGAPPSAAMADPAVAAYRRYVVDAQAAGVPTIPFEQFTQISTDAHQAAAALRPPPGAVQMAAGGPVPGGRMVFDTNPGAPTDSIPAVIDGQRPAKLDSGEFIIPKDVAMYYGTKFLNGLIEKAKAGGKGGAPAADMEEVDEPEEMEYADGGAVGVPDFEAMQRRAGTSAAIAANQAIAANPAAATNVGGSGMNFEDLSKKVGVNAAARALRGEPELPAEQVAAPAPAPDYSEPQMPGATQLTGLPVGATDWGSSTQRMRQRTPSLTLGGDDQGAMGYAQGGLISAYNTLKNRGATIDAAVSGAVNPAPAPTAPPAQVAASPYEVRLSAAEQAMLEQNRAREAAAEQTQKPAWKRALGFAGGGMIEPGNIDLARRPVVRNPNGSISTVRTMGIEEDGRHVNIPTVSPDGRIMSDREAVGLYREFGKHLGAYDSRDAAGAAARALHEDQGRIYRGAVQQYRGK